MENCEKRVDSKAGDQSTAKAFQTGHSAHETGRHWGYFSSNI